MKFSAGDLAFEGVAVSLAVLDLGVHWWVGSAFSNGKIAAITSYIANRSDAYRVSHNIANRARWWMRRKKQQDAMLRYTRGAFVILGDARTRSKTST